MLSNSAKPIVVDLFCSNCQASKKFLKSTFIKTWPKYLFINVKRFIFKDWVPKKSHALINFPPDKEVTFEQLLMPKLKGNEK